MTEYLQLNDRWTNLTTDDLMCRKYLRRTLKQVVNNYDGNVFRPKDPI